MTSTFAYDFNTPETIKKAALELVEHLDRELVRPSDSWTRANFDALDSFPAQGFELKRFHRGNGSEFLWDYIASDNKQGIYLVAESEKYTGTRDAERIPLRHDFEKLLYVFSPLHLMICKASSETDADRISRELSAYAKTCSLNFPPASIFILYCRISPGCRACYTWQALGEPSPLSNECIDFKLC